MSKIQSRSRIHRRIMSSMLNPVRRTGAGCGGGAAAGAINAAVGAADF